MKNTRLAILISTLLASCANDAGHDPDTAILSRETAAVPLDVPELVAAMGRAERLTLRAFNDFHDLPTRFEPSLVTQDPEVLRRFVSATELKPIHGGRHDPVGLSVCGGHYVELDLDDGGRITLKSESWGGARYALVWATGWTHPCWFFWSYDAIHSL